MIIYPDGWKPIPLPESTKSRCRSYRPEPDTDISSFEFPEISYRFDIKSIVPSVSFCQAHATFVSHKSIMLLQVNHHCTVSTYVRSDWYKAAEPDKFPA